MSFQLVSYIQMYSYNLMAHLEEVDEAEVMMEAVAKDLAADFLEVDLAE